MLLRVLRIAKEIIPMDHFIRINDTEGLLNFLDEYRPNEILPYHMSLAKDKPLILLLLNFYKSTGETFSKAEYEKLAVTRPRPARI